MRLSTAITRLVGIDHPVLLAPMGGVSGGELAGAVSAAGGLGLIGAGYADAAVGFGSDDWIGSEFDKAGNHAVGIGFITWALDRRPGALDVALERQPHAVMLSFGDITPYAAKIREAGAILISQVQTLKDAREAAAKGAQIIVAQLPGITMWRLSFVILWQPTDALAGDVIGLVRSVRARRRLTVSTHRRARIRWHDATAASVWIACNSDTEWRRKCSMVVESGAAPAGWAVSTTELLLGLRRYIDRCRDGSELPQAVRFGVKNDRSFDFNP